MTYTVVTLPHATQRVNPAGFCERVNGIWFVCLETSNDLMFSTSNGVVWAKADDSETGHTGVVTYVGWDGTRYVRIRGGLLAYSTDLQAWTAKASPFTVATWPARMAWNGTNWCTSGRAESGTQYIAYATDPTGTWTKQSTGLTTAPGVTVVSFDGTWFLGSEDAIESSTNLTSWTSLAWSAGGQIDLFSDGTALFASYNTKLRQYHGTDAYWANDGWDYLCQSAGSALSHRGVINSRFAHFDTVGQSYLHTGRYDAETEYVLNRLASTWAGTAKTVSAICHGGDSYLAFIEDTGTPHQADHAVPVEVTTNRMAYFRLSNINLSSGSTLKIGDLRLLKDGTRVAQSVINADSSPTTGTLANLIDGSLSSTAEWTTQPDSITTNYVGTQLLNQTAIGAGDSSSKHPYDWNLDGSVDQQRWYRLARAYHQRFPGTNTLAQPRGFFFDAAATSFDYGTLLTAKAAPTLPSLGGGDHYEPEQYLFVNGYWILTFYNVAYDSTPAYYSADLTTWGSLGDAAGSGWAGVWYANGKWFKQTDTLYQASTINGSWTAVPLPSGWTFVNEVLGYFDGFYWLRKGTGSTSYAYSSDLVDWAFRDPTAQVAQRLPIDASFTPHWITASGVSTSKLTAATGSGTSISYAVKLASEDTSGDNVTLYRNGLHHYAYRNNFDGDVQYLRYDQTSEAFAVCPTFYTFDSQPMGVDAAGRMWLRRSNETAMALGDSTQLYVYTPGSVCWKRLDFSLSPGADEWVQARVFSAGNEQMWVTFDYATNTTKVYSFAYSGPSDTLAETSDAANTATATASLYDAIRETLLCAADCDESAHYNLSMSEAQAAIDSLIGGKLFQDAVSEVADGGVSTVVEIALRMVEQVAASDAALTSWQTAMTVAEVATALDLVAAGWAFSVVETAEANDTITPFVAMLATLLEEAVATDTLSNTLTVTVVSTETAAGADTVTTMAEFFETMDESVVAAVTLRLGDDVYTGWALNTEEGAVSEFQRYEFNSFCQLRGEYYAAGTDGIYRIGGSSDAGEAIVGYLKTGLLDFGSSLQKRMDSAWLAIATDGAVRMKVVTTDGGEAEETWYQVVSKDDGAVAENLRLKIGKGLKSRHWQFELVVEDASEFAMDELQLIPMILSRRT